MDPNLQVAFVSVLATLITTAGVVIVAIINNRKERTGAAGAAVEATLDEGDVLKRMLALISEKEAQAKTIRNLRRQIRDLQLENTSLRLTLKTKKEES